MLIGLPVPYFLIASREQWGLDAGATGLAIKMVSLQLIAVNVQLYFNSMFLKLSFWKYLGHQALCVGCLIAIAIIASFGVDNVLGLHENIIPSFLLAGVLYTVMVIVLVYCVPVVAGLHRQDIQSVVRILLTNLERK
jgi:cation transport ATPase